MSVEEKPKAVSLVFIEKAGHSKMYALIDKLVAAHHPHLCEAQIALAWNRSWKEDKDGILVLGRAKKADELFRQKQEFDLVIMLNEEAWGELQDFQQEALLDHELCHFEVQADEDEQPKRDEFGRICYRMRKHDIEEFRCIIERHGCYKMDLELAVRAALEAKKRPLLKVAEERRAQ